MKKLLDKLFGLDNTFIIFFILSIVTSFLSYFYQIFLGNKMNLADYGVFNSLNSLCSNILCFYTPLAVYICRVMAEADGNYSCIRGIAKKVCYFVVLLSAAVAVAIIGMFLFGYGERLSLLGIVPIGIVIVTVISGGVYSVFNGALQGANHLALYGIAGFLVVAIKMGITYACMRVSINVFIPLIAMFISNSAIIVFVFFFLKRTSKKTYENTQMNFVSNKDLLGLYGITFIANLLISPYVNGGEILLMSTEYETDVVGLYSLAITIVKASIYIISILTSALLPRFAAISLESKRLYKRYILSLGACFLIGVLWVIGIALVGIRIIPAIFGEGYYVALLNTKYMALWVINLGVLLDVNTFYLATNQLKKYIFVLGCSSVLIVILVKVIKVSFWQIPVFLGIITGAIVVWSLFDAFVKMRNCTLDD